MTTKITFNKIGQEVKREQPFSFVVHYTCTNCWDCPDFDRGDCYCRAQEDDLFFRNFYDVYGSIHPECPKRKEVI